MDISVYIGAYVEVPKIAQASNRCGSRGCGAKMKAGQRFCAECGTRAGSESGSGSKYPEPDSMPDGLGDELTTYGETGNCWIDQKFRFGFELRDLETDGDMALDFEKFSERVASARAHYQPLIDAFLAKHGEAPVVRFGEVHYWG